MSKTYVPGHCHTEFSLLDGQIKIPEYVAKCKNLGISAAAITDHGNMNGSMEFYIACKKEGIKPIIGIEMYTCSDINKKDKDNRKLNHLILWAKNFSGYLNLLKLSSLANIDGFYYKPRIDNEMLRKYSTGLMGASACVQGVIAQHVLNGDYGAAERAILDYKDIFSGEFFIELQRAGLPIQERAEKGLIMLAKKTGTKLIATSDAHYLNKEDAVAQRVLLCVNMNNKYQAMANQPDDKRMGFFDSEEFYVHSPDEMYEKFKDIPEAVDNTNLVADMINLEIPLPGVKIAKFKISPEYKNSNEYLRQLCREGWKRLKIDNKDKRYLERVNHELEVIEKVGISDYFLVVADMCKYADDSKIPRGVGRGCLKGDVDIWTSNGYKNIKDISVGDIVISHMGEFRKVKKVFSYDIKEELVNVRSHFDDGRGVSLTKDHKILIEKVKIPKIIHKPISKRRRYLEPTGNLFWEESKNIEKGDLVCVPIPKFKKTNIKFVDLKNYIPEENKKDIDISKDFLIESVRINKGYNCSKRDISRRYGITRNAISDIVKEKSTVRKFTKERFLGILKENGFRSVKSWKKYCDTKKIIKKKIKRFIRIDKDLCFLYGFFIANGWIKQDGNLAFGFAVRNSKNDNRIKKLCKKVFGYECNGSVHKTSDLIQFNGYSYSIYKFFKMHCPGYKYTAITKSFSPWIYGLNKELRMSFLKGLWYGDGCVLGGKTVYSTSSPSLAYQVRTLLWSLGLPASFSYYDRKEKRKEFKNTRRSYTIRTTNGFKSKTDFAYSDKNYIYMRVNKVTNINFSGKVYDFEVDKDHSFLTSSYIVHNSAAGSLVSYLLNITGVDPIKYDLIFERFYNQGRGKAVEFNGEQYVSGSLPDIDLDFSWARRGEVIEYIRSKYGYVANIVTFNSMSARCVLKDVARVLDIDYDLANTITDLIPKIPDIELKEAYVEEPKLLEYRAKYTELFTIAERLEGCKRNLSIHAAGILVSHEPLEGRIPLCIDPKTKTVFSGYDMGSAEQAGLMKIDVLSLRTLDAIDMCVNLVNQKEKNVKKLEKRPVTRNSRKDKKVGAAK